MGVSGKPCPPGQVSSTSNIRSLMTTGTRLGFYRILVFMLGTLRKSTSTTSKLGFYSTSRAPAWKDPQQNSRHRLAK